jgi:putative inorganic carbon (HCO3(-)) transporter
MDVPIFLLSVMLVVSLIPSVAPELSLNRLCIYLLGVSLFYGMVNGLHTERHVHWMGIALVLLGLLVAIVALLGTDWKIGLLVDIPAIYGRLPGPLIRGLPGSGVIEKYDLFNPRVVAGALAILLPLPIAYVVFGEGRRLRLLSGCVALVMTAVLFLTQAPQGFLGLVAALFLLALWRSRWFLLSLPLVGGGVLILWRFVAARGGWGSWLPPDTSDTLAFGVQSRLVNSLRGLGMLRDMPYTGIGLNTFPVVDGLYSFGRSHAEHAHNMLIQTAVDLGMPGVMALLALLAGFAYTAYRVNCARPDYNQRALLVGICAGVAAWLAYGLLDSITLGHKPAAALWVMLGLSASMRIQTDADTGRVVPFPRRFGRRWCIGVLLPLLLLAAIAVISHRELVGAFYLNLGVIEAHRALAADSETLAEQHLDSAKAHLRTAWRWDPHRPRTHTLFEWVAKGGIQNTRWPRDTAGLRTPCPTAWIEPEWDKCIT